MPLRLAFMGTPDFAVPTLVEIVGRGHEVAAVYTRAPKPAGRGMALQPSPVARVAERFGIPVMTPTTLRDDAATKSFAALGADAAVVVAYGLILPPAILDVPALGAFNVHASLLPRWRGAAPINRAIMAGDAETGVTIMRMAEGLDTGPMAMAERVPIPVDATAGELHDTLARLGADLMLRALGALERGTLTLTPQPEAGASYARKIAKEETRIDWSKPWRAVHDRCRGLSPFPGAWFPLAGDTRVKVLRTSRGEGVGAPGTVLDAQLTIACGDGAVRIATLQRAGRAPMSAEEFLRGVALAPGDAASVSIPDIAPLLRAENAGDAPAIRAVLAAAFPTTAEADLVERLRADDDFVLALVARAPGGIIGYAGFVRLMVDDAPAVGLAPLAVTPAWQRRGVGAALVRAGLHRLASGGETLCVVLGDPDYYGRFGFDVEAARAFASDYAGPHLMALHLAPHAPQRGTLRYPSAFAALEA